MEIKLAALKNGQSATIIQINLPEAQTDRLSVMGLYVGQKVQKKCNQPLKGPLSLQINRSSMAISSRIASYIIVDTDE